LSYTRNARPNLLMRRENTTPLARRNALTISPPSRRI
jgi:hypothetical protein